MTEFRNPKQIKDPSRKDAKYANFGEILLTADFRRQTQIIKEEKN